MGAALALAGPAAAGTRVAVDATVAEDLRTVHGTLRVESDAPLSLVDPLAALPIPEVDEVMHATFPGAVDRGAMRWSPVDEHTWAFTTTLPRRYGDIGSTRAFGLMGNGGWYPQPLGPEGLPLADWDVRVRLPTGTAGSLGDVTGTGSLAWRGRGERASLAVVRHGRVTALEAGGARVDLLTRGRPRPALVRAIRGQLPGVVPEVGPGHGVVVEAPLRRRLVRPGVRAAYLSDRAWRLSPGFARFHHVAGMRAVASALLDLPDPFARDLAAASIIARYGEEVRGTSAASALRWVAWIPIFDRMLEGEHTPFITEILEEPIPGDPLADDLVEVLDPHWPASAVVAQVEDAWGPEAARAFGRSLEAGQDLDIAALAAGIDAAWLRSLRQPLPVQDYRLAVERAPTPRVLVTREAPPEAPAEVVTLEVDGVPRRWRAGPGPDTWIHEGLPGSVVVDPEGHVAQTSTALDAWPTRYTPVVAAWFSRVDLRQLYFDGFAQVSMRRRGDTRWSARARIYADEQTLVGGEVGATRQLGRELDGLRRAHQLDAWVSPSALSTRYAPVDGGRLALGAGASWAWDTRVATFFPLRGHRLELGVDGGLTPGSDASWRAARAASLVMGSPHPRVALSFEGLGGLAEGTVTHRLMDLGGLDGMRSLPPATVIGDARAIGRFEARWAALHDASLPAVVLWLDHLYLGVGAEAGVARVEGAPVGAVGVDAGVGWQVALLGANPSYARLRVGWPAWLDGVDPAEAKGPQVVLETEKLF